MASNKPYTHAQMINVNVNANAHHVARSTSRGRGGGSGGSQSHSRVTSSRVETSVGDAVPRTFRSPGAPRDTASYEQAIAAWEASPRPLPNNITTYLHNHNYQLGKIIGEGSYSKVRITSRYLPDGTESYRLACKIINKRRASEDFVTKFLPREIDVISQIEHKNIIHVYDLVEFDDNVYIFMDWCDQGDLLEHVKARGHISEHRSKFYFRQLVSAVQYLHGLDFAHRDLKCENILMKAHKDQLLISDFGFARYCRENGKRVLSTTYCGSAAYASPEILQGIPYNPKLYDLWSLGCVLFIMMTGHMPYDESNVGKMLQAQQSGSLYYPPPSDRNISDLGKGFIRRMLEPDVTRRCNIDQASNHEWLTLASPPPSETRHHQEQEKYREKTRSHPQLESAGGDSDLTAPSHSPREASSTHTNEPPATHRLRVSRRLPPQTHFVPADPQQHSEPVVKTPESHRVPHTSRMPATPRGPRTGSPQFAVTSRTSGHTASAPSHHRHRQSQHKTGSESGSLHEDSGYFTASPSTPAPPTATRTFYNSNLHDRDESHSHSRVHPPGPAPVSGRLSVKSAHPQTPAAPPTPTPHGHRQHHRDGHRDSGPPGSGRSSATGRRP